MNIVAAIAHDHNLGSRLRAKVPSPHRTPFFVFVALLLHIRIADFALYIDRIADVLRYISSSAVVLVKGFLSWIDNQICHTFSLL